MKHVLLVLTVAVLATASTGAQWLRIPTPGIPRTPDGKPNLAAPAPRTPEGRPVLGGLWKTVPARLIVDVTAGLPRGEKLPYQPWAEAVYKERIETNGKDHPGVRCWPSGIPEKLNIPDGLKLVQTPDAMLFLHESRTIYRQVFTDGRKLPRVPEDAQPMWMGYSVGRWEGDTFVVETIGQNGRTWLDMKGLPGTEALRVIERYTRPSIGRIFIDVTIDDPKAYTKPWDVRLSWDLQPDVELIESICEENNRDLPHMVGK